LGTTTLYKLPSRTELKKEKTGEYSISAIIPAFNEEGWVGETVKTLCQLSEIDEIIVIDDGSTDRTAHEAGKAGAVVYRSIKNCGKSSSLYYGANIAQGDVFVFVDADLKHSAFEVKKLIHAVINDEADMAIGAVKLTAKSGLGLTLALAEHGIRYYTGRKMLSPLSGQRALKRYLWESLNFYADGFAAEVALTIESIKKGFNVKEIPLDITHRFRGNDLSSFFHRARQFYSIMKLLVQTGMRV